MLFRSVIPLGAPVFKEYQLQVDDDPLFAGLNVSQSVGSINMLQFTPSTPLVDGKKYYWRVRAVNINNEVSNWSVVFNFRTPYLAPTSLTPAGAVIGLRPPFDWADVNGATGYTIQVSRNSTFTLLVVNANTVSSTYTPLVNLPATTLYWRVRATGPNSRGPWSATIAITVSP